MPVEVKKIVARAPRDLTAGAFFWLSAFFVVYCARPEDWTPGLAYIPLAKISAMFAIIGLMSVAGRTKRAFKDLPRESKYLLAMVLLLFAESPLSPVWRGGAFFNSITFGKVYFGWVLTFFLVTTLPRLRRLIFIQAGSVSLVSVISVLKGSSHPRLKGVLGGIYSNPNDLAFAIVLSLPLVLLLLLTSKKAIYKVMYSLAMLLMVYTLFRTASRAGFIDLIVSIPIALWFFGVKGRRPQLILVTLLIGGLLFAVAGKHLRERFAAMSGSNIETGEEQGAYGSYEERKALMWKAVDAMVHYPLTGVGCGDFIVYSGIWKVVHSSYLQIGSEGGFPVLILYLLFFYTGFQNLKKLRRKKDLDPEARFFVWALYTSLIGFMVGSCFAPEAYQFFPFFTIAYISALAAIVREGEAEAQPATVMAGGPRLRGILANYRRPNAIPTAR
jgi:O-antigen ligase